jgi:hypothetical protein
VLVTFLNYLACLVFLHGGAGGGASSLQTLGLELALLPATFARHRADNRRKSEAAQPRETNTPLTRCFRAGTLLAN